MNTLIYELFSGVGLCNQLFSLETAIYMANISGRKLVLIIKNPLCHCGKATWDYGYLMNFFTNEFLEYLPNGFEVFYNKVPQEIDDMIKNKSLTKHITYPARFSHVVFVDRELDTDLNKPDIEEFLHKRTKTYTEFDTYSSYTNLFITQSNAARCLYNFYTTPDNYRLMYDICRSLKFKSVFYELSEKIYTGLSPEKKNKYDIFIHLRFGDYHKDKLFLTRNNEIMLNNIIPYIDGHTTNCIRPSVFLLCDNKNNTEFLNKISKYKPVMVDKITENVFNEHMIDHKMIFRDFHKCKNNSVNYAIIDMLLASKADDFLGTITSTFSNQIQFMRYVANKPCNRYTNVIGSQCSPIPQVISKYDWVRFKYNGGHPVAWHMFWDPNMKPSGNLLTIHGKTDGFGSQLHAIFSLIAYCNYMGTTYIHTPMYKMHHNDENHPDFPKLMNDFINIEHRFKTMDDLTSYEQSTAHRTLEGPIVHGSYNPEYFYNEYTLDMLRDIYFSRDKPDVTYDPSHINIALHIRRGDVTTKKYTSRYTSNIEYINIVKKMDYPPNSVIHVFSEGEESDFQDIVDAFRDVNVVMHINENICLTFHHLVMADIMVVARSSFSYCAGLINKNVIVANNIKNWWHKPLASWKMIE